MKTIKIEKEVTVEDVFAVTRTPNELSEVERIFAKTDLPNVGSKFFDTYYIKVHEGSWYKCPSFYSVAGRVEITIPQLAELLGVEYPLKQLPTLEELIAEAKSKITVKTESYPCWVEGSKEVTTYTCAGLEYYSKGAAIAGYISKKIEREYL